jgi:RES domain-containing protein
VKLWRISDYLDLGGEGGLHVDGRWNSVGRLIVYTAESSALAMLEVLVRYGRKQLPPPFQLLEIDVPGDLTVTPFEGETPVDVAVSQRWGDEWLAAGRTTLAKVPSAVAPESFNFLINPLRAEAARITLKAHAHYPWDARLFR